VLDFAKANPQLKVHAVVGAGKHPVAIGSYAIGNDKVIDIKNAEPERILAVCAELRNTTGRKITKIKQELYGTVESVQGKWEPTFRCVGRSVRGGCGGWGGGGGAVTRSSALPCCAACTIRLFCCHYCCRLRCFCFSSYRWWWWSWWLRVALAGIRR
jgi:hypothetical protein